MSTSTSSHRHMPLLLIFALTSLIAWGFWLIPLLGRRRVLHVDGLIFFIVGGSFAPLIMPFISKGVDGGWPAMHVFAMRALRFRLRPQHLLASLLLVASLGHLATVIHAHLGGPATTLAMPIARIPSLFLLLFFVGGSLDEEFCTRGFPCCRPRSCWA